MKDYEILDKTFQSVFPILNCTGNWEKHANKEMDALVTIIFPIGEFHFDALLKKEVRENTIRNIQNLNDTYPNFLLVAYRIYPKYRQLLQEMRINYLEASGNAFIQKNGVYILIDKFTPLKDETKDTARAFTKTGLRVFFQLLIDDKNLETNQRDLAHQAGVALGNVPLVLNNLKEAGLLVKTYTNGYRWVNKEEAIATWISGYRNTLKPSLYQGRYRLPKDTPWMEIQLPTSKTKWGGEPGGDILTNYLRPEHLTLFTELNKPEFIKATRMMPDKNGEVEVYETFWEKDSEIEKCAPPLLVYADLMINGDKRSLETANMIYEKYLGEL
ncbi:type IV toxin-antitoxin system AbiEi family antitoxin [Algoriphagus sp.]|uniref:type IV toxin-antitoxin system AbiEi family antitoxin n=1 Tax=Algoriphagus sp. TaxID=1872435 RepID=UPI0026305060|nr:type IV toxin-antitoxin system AbiEi family antitoxin [Algoriphagus sp.]